MALFKVFEPEARKRRRAADRARDTGDHARAAQLYSEYLSEHPQDGAIHIQAGHMLKETGMLAEASAHYDQALALRPNDADLALQLGHFHKLTGNLERCEAEYRRALTLRPDWDEPERELANLAAWGWLGTPTKVRPDIADIGVGEPSVSDAAVLHAMSGEGLLVPELVASSPDTLLHQHENRFHLRRLGRHERSHWGMMRTMRGIEAVRGFWTADKPIREVVISLGRRTIRRAPVSGPFILKYEINQRLFKKYVFNEWIDFSRFERGRYLLSIDAVEVDGGIRHHEEHVLVADPLAPEAHPKSDGIIDVALAQDGMLEERINAQPTQVHPARRSLFVDDPKTILVLRTDQLGDMVASAPAMQKLRAMFPRAKIVGLLTAGNADFGATLGVFDEVLVVDFPDDPVQRRRVMGLEAQGKLKARLAPYKFDLAIDLADAGVSRPLLLLSGAPVLFGFRDREFAYLTAGYEGNSHDVWNRMECVGHSTQAMSLIGRLEALTQTPACTVRRTDLSPDRLDRFGLIADRRYVLLHAGARIEYSRWPHYHELAALILRETDMDVVMMGLEGQARATLPDALMRDGRFRLIEGLLPFDDFDALISFAAVFVGNDSGPKHLASLRGTKVVGLHLARNNWTEWGQENSGVVLSRKVPCAGCNIFYEGEECGKDYVCLRNITPREVLDAALLIADR